MRGTYIINFKIGVFEISARAEGEPDSAEQKKFVSWFTNCLKEFAKMKISGVYKAARTFFLGTETLRIYSVSRIGKKVKTSYYQF